MSMNNKETQKYPLNRQEIYSPELKDQFGRTFDYLRIAVNEKCILRCIFCMPEEGVPFKPENVLLTKEEIERLIKISARLGVRKVRFTGGEPLLRKDIIELIRAAVNTTGIRSVHLTTNGVLLQSKVSRLQEAGLSGVNISLDTLDSEKFKKIARRDNLSNVISGLDSALSSESLVTKLNVVVMRNFNEDELIQFANLTKDRNVIVRFIELMPFDSQQIWKTGKFYSSDQIINDLRCVFPQMVNDSGTRTEHSIYRIPEYRGKIAVIPAYSRHLCGSCNRIRITADGRILNCLFSDDETSIIDRMRGGESNKNLSQLIKTAMWEKLENGWEAQKAGAEQRNSMTQIGG